MTRLSNNRACKSELNFVNKGRGGWYKALAVVRVYSFETRSFIYSVSLNMETHQWAIISFAYQVPSSLASHCIFWVAHGIFSDLSILPSVYWAMYISFSFNPTLFDLNGKQPRYLPALTSEAECMNIVPSLPISFHFLHSLWKEGF